MDIMEAVCDLLSKQHSQSGPILIKLGYIGCAIQQENPKTPSVSISNHNIWVDSFKANGDCRNLENLEMISFQTSMKKRTAKTTFYLLQKSFT